jgi:hypothetical protein
VSDDLPDGVRIILDAHERDQRGADIVGAVLVGVLAAAICFALRWCCA